MAEITTRDISLFKAIASGIATLEMIMSVLYDVYAVKIEKTALEKRISILRADGYIISRKYPRFRKPNHKTLYSLSKKALVVLTAIGHPVEQIRYGLPTDTMAMHEVTVTKTLHVGARESAKGDYKFKFTHSSILKQSRKKKSSDPIPDLYIQLTHPDGHITIVKIEIDMGTIHAYAMAKRLRELSSLKEIILVLCVSRARIDGIREACMRIYTRDLALVFFALQEDFHRKGFRATELINIKGQNNFLNLHIENDD